MEIINSHQGDPRASSAFSLHGCTRVCPCVLYSLHMFSMKGV